MESYNAYIEKNTTHKECNQRLYRMVKVTRGRLILIETFLKSF